VAARWAWPGLRGTFGRKVGMAGADGTCGSKVGVDRTKGDVRPQSGRGRHRGGHVAAKWVWPGPWGACDCKEGVAGFEGDVWP